MIAYSIEIAHMTLCAIRITKVSSTAQLRGIALHAQRRSEAARSLVRSGAEAGAALLWAGSEAVSDPRDAAAALQACRIEAGAGLRKGAQICLHALCILGQDWVRAAGDLHDPNNPRNRALFAEARAWAQSWVGEGGVVSARLDLDEAGGAVVDLLLAPVRLSRGQPVISTAKALKELQLAWGERSEYAALQTSWAVWCQQHLDASIARGVRGKKAVVAAKGAEAMPEVPVRLEAASEGLSPYTGEAVARKGLSDAQLAAVLAPLSASAPFSAESIAVMQAWLLLRRECDAHLRNPEGYRPPESLDPEDEEFLLAAEATLSSNVWLVIHAARRGAQEVLAAAALLGIGLEDDLARFEAGKPAFPRYIDRVHIGAVLAKCSRFAVLAEARLKQEALIAIGSTARAVQPDDLTPRNSADTLARHNRRIRRNLNAILKALPAEAVGAKEKGKPKATSKTAVKKKWVPTPRAKPKEG